MLFNGVVITTPSKASSKPHTGSASPASKTDPISGDTLAAVPTTLRTKGTHSNRPAITARKRKRGLKGESEDETRAICGLRGREVPSSRCRSASPSPDIISSGSVDPDSPTPQQTSLLDAFNTAGRRNEHKPRRSRSASSSVHAESSRLSGHSSTPQPSSLLDAFNAAAQHNKRTRQRLVPYVELVRRTSDSPSPKQRLLRPRKRSSEPRPRYVRDRAPSVVEASDALEQAAPVRLQERLREETGSEDALILMNTRWLRQALEERSPPKVEDEVYPTRMVDHSSKAVRFVAMLEECYGPGTRIPSAVDAKPKKGVLKARAASRDKSPSPIDWRLPSQESPIPHREGSLQYQAISVTDGQVQTEALSGHGNTGTRLPASAGEGCVYFDPKDSNESVPASSSHKNLEAEASEWVAAIQRLVKGKVSSTREDLIQLSNVLQHIDGRKKEIDATVLQDTQLWESIAQLGELPEVPFNDEHKLRGRARALLASWQKSLRPSPSV